MTQARTLGLLLVLATLLVFLRTTGNEFINYDDPSYVVENSFVNQGLSLAGIRWAFTSAHAANWHPLTWISHMVDCDLFRLNPAGPHLVNTLFHAANAGLLFALILRLTNPPGRAAGRSGPPNNLWVAALVAALFAWHPLHVESVAWVSERKDVLSTFFSLLALLSYTRHAQTRRAAPAAAEGGGCRPGRDYLLALLAFSLALLAKPMPVTLPLVMLILDFWPLQRWIPGPGGFRTGAGLVVEKLPFAAGSAAVCVITVLVQHHAESSLLNIPPGLRLENLVAAYSGYLGLMLWPLHLAVIYPYPARLPLRPVVESALILTGISVLAWRERRTQPWLLAGWAWYVVTLIPVIGIIQVGAQSMADRYTYFPLIGIFLAVAFSLQTAARQYPGAKAWLIAVAGAGLVACLGLTEWQLGFWHDSETLFRHAIKVENSEVARLNLGSALQEQHQVNEALTQFMVAWRMEPESVLANFDVAGILATQGKTALSAAYYERAVRHDTWNPVVFENYGRELVALKRYAEAERAFSRAIQIEPDDARPHFLLARVELEEGEDAPAVAELDQAMKLEPQNLQTTLYAASVLASCEDAKVRDGKRARELAQQVVAATGGKQAAALDVLAMSSAELGRYPDAVLIEQAAIQAAASQPEGLDLLQQHLACYELRQPWRESFKAGASE